LTRRRRLSSEERSMGMAVVFCWVERRRLEAAWEEGEGRARRS
jgi:hypothetical protein